MSQNKTRGRHWLVRHILSAVSSQLSIAWLPLQLDVAPQQRRVTELEELGLNKCIKHHPLHTHIELLFYEQENKNLLCSAIAILRLCVQ